MAYINLNGKITESNDPALQAGNRAFRYGYGLFETILVKEGSIQLKEYHWQRLRAGMEQLRFTIPALLTSAKLEQEILRTVEKNKLQHMCRVRLQIFPGNGGLFDADSFKAEYLVECYPLEEHIIQLNETGLSLGIARGLVKQADDLSNLKSCSALVYAMAARQARDNKWNDAFILNTKGHIIETSIANVFWLKDDKIYTPPLSEGCIAGVMRAYILDKAAEKGIPIKEKALTAEDLLQADEVFLTNAIRRMKWVKTAENAAYGCTGTQRFSAIIF
jgi:branched-chain amino acid aminotransferase